MSIPRLHQSIVKDLLKCPAIARHRLETERKKATKAMERGTLVDQLVFGGANFHTVSARLKSGPKKGELATNWQCAEAQEQAKEARARGQVPVFEHELEAAQQVAGAVRARLLEEGIELGQCIKQDTVQWTSRLGVECEGTPDLAYLVREGLKAHSYVHKVITIDLKVGENADPEYLDDHIYNMGWDIQGAAYQEAMAFLYPEAEGRGAHWVLASDANPPNCITFAPLSPAYLAIGQARWERGQHLWVACQATGVWPEYVNRPLSPSKRVYFKEGSANV
jgi:hypothetical protein